jgi:shikimate kinase
MNGETRARIRAQGVSVWLKADIEVLLKRVRRRADRPLLKADDPELVLRRLMDQRYPVYAEADLTVVSREASHDDIVDEVIGQLAAHLVAAPAGPGRASTDSAAS